MKKRIAAIIIAPLLGAVIGYLLVYALDNRWFRSNWQRIESPPGGGLHLLGLSEDSLWVQNAAGTIYYNENSSTCLSDCWHEVTEVPVLPIGESDQVKVTGGPCAPSLPLMGVTERISECRRSMWVDYNFTFALRRDGSIYLWQADLYKEWSFVLLIIGICGGALVMFIPVTLIVLILGLLDRRSKRANKPTEY